MGDRDHSRSPRGGLAALSHDEIMRHIVARERARQAKDFAQADEVRDFLKQEGITLFDKTAEWKSNDGRSGRIPNFAQIEAGNFPSEAGHLPMVDTYAVGDDSIAHIKHLIQMREQARGAKNFAESDRLRDELKALGVELFDKEKLWRAQNGTAGVMIGFSTKGLTDQEINCLVLQREKARSGNDYGTADMIRDELKAHGLDIFDKDKMWRCRDGRSGHVPSWDAANGMSSAPQQIAPVVQQVPAYSSYMMPYGMAPMGNGGGVSADMRNQIVQAALDCARTPQSAHRTLQLLRATAAEEAYRMAAPAPYGKAPTALVHKAAAPPRRQAAAGPKHPNAIEATEFVNRCQATGHYVTDVEIHWLVELREKVRKDKDFNSADHIRDVLRDKIGITLMEKEKIWKCNDGRTGPIPAWTEIAA